MSAPTTDSGRPKSSSVNGRPFRSPSGSQQAVFLKPSTENTSKSGAQPPQTQTIGQASPPTPPAPLASLRTMLQRGIEYFTPQTPDQQWSIIGDKLLRQPEIPIERTKQLSRLVRRFGVPDSIRAAFWMNVSGATAHSIEGKGEYWHTVNVVFAKQQRALLAEKSGEEMSAEVKTLQHTMYEIESDVVRISFDTFLTTQEGREQLRRVLAVYSQMNPTVGYCQTMSIMAKMLLSKLPEEEAFWMLKTIVDFIIPEGYFAEDMHGVLVDVRVFNIMAHQQLPRLMEELDNEGIVLDVFLPKWFPSLFIGCVEEHLGDRIIDLVLYRGFKILFRIGLALLSILEDELNRFDSERENVTADSSAKSLLENQQDSDAGNDDDDVTRPGFIMSTLQKLPETVTESVLLERTFSFHAHTTEVNNLRNSVKQIMAREKQLSAAPQRRTKSNSTPVSPAVCFSTPQTAPAPSPISIPNPMPTESVTPSSTTETPMSFMLISSGGESNDPQGFSADL